MTVEFQEIVENPEGFKVCFGCFYINAFDNKKCIHCGEELFKYDGETVNEVVSSLYDRYEDDGYTTDEVDIMTIEV